MIARLTLLCLTALSALAILPPRVALAQDNLVVVELFTSQGCSACPPADEMLRQLAGRDDVIALALHVDYWDYIGWTDTFASPAYTQRQYGYAHAAGSTLVYTPQIVIDGVAHVPGHQPMAVADLIAAHGQQQYPVSVAVTAFGGHVRLEATPEAALPEQIEVHLVRYLPHATVDIQRGENAGRVSEHANVVRDWSVVAEWDGRAPLVLDLALEGDLPHAVLFQAAGPGAILGAVRLDRP